MILILNLNSIQDFFSDRFITIDDHKYHQYHKHVCNLVTYEKNIGKAYTTPEVRQDNCYTAEPSRRSSVRKEIHRFAPTVYNKAPRTEI